MTTRWKVVYTKHKTQKRKVWQDGFIDIGKRKLMLFADEDGNPSKSAIDEMFLNSNTTIEAGVIIESPGFLVDPEDIITDSLSVAKAFQHEVSLTQRSEIPQFQKPKFPSFRSCSGKENEVKMGAKSKRPSFSRFAIKRAADTVVSSIQKQRRLITETIKAVFPGAKTCIVQLTEQKSKEPPICSNNTAPCTFSNLREYASLFKSALLVELNIALNETAFLFCHQYWRITDIEDSPFVDLYGKLASWPRCSSHSTLCRLDSRYTGSEQIYRCPLTSCSNQYRNGNSVMSSGLKPPTKMAISLDACQRASFFQKNGILYYSDCQIFRQFHKQPGSKMIVRDGSKMRLFLKLPNVKQPSSAFSMYDCWVVSTSPSFEAEGPGFWLLIAYSMYHAPSKAGMLELCAVTGSQIPPQLKLKGVHENLFVIMVGNIRSEMMMLSHLEALSISDSNDLLSFILNPCKLSISSKFRLSSHEISNESVSTLSDSLIQEFFLNPEQASVLKNVQSWLFNEPDISPRSPIILVHGIFGAGKSHLLAAIVIFLCRFFEDSQDKTSRILIASLTNVAVDRILLILKDRQFNDFARVGSVKKIAKPILKHVIHWNEKSGSQEESDKQALQAYREMLNDPEITGLDRKHISEAYDELLQQRTQQRAERLRNTRVVGVTCASSCVEILSGSEFTFTLLDECSQMTEPMSLLPLTKFKSKYAILVGDPMQLPPTLRSTTETGQCSGISLKQTLFVRLHSAGIQPTVLIRQYRCHPVLSRLCSQLFYADMIQDGCSISDRAPLVSGLLPLSFMDTSKLQSKQILTSNGSFYNPVDISAIQKIVKQIITSLNPTNISIGIIALYKSQEQHLHAALAQTILKQPELDLQISTVDAFQGSEKDIIILSTVRSNGIGFINCPHRLNVALSRAKRHMIIAGSASALQSDPLWMRIIEYSKFVVSAHPPFHFQGLPEMLRSSTSPITPPTLHIHAPTAQFFNNIVVSSESVKDSSISSKNIISSEIDQIRNPANEDVQGISEIKSESPQANNAKRAPVQEITKNLTILSEVPELNRDPWSWVNDDHEHSPRIIVSQQASFQQPLHEFEDIDISFTF